MVRISRRQALAATLATGVAACGEKREPHSTATALPANAFRHGVASGDPAPGSMVLWTRLAPPETASATEVYVVWEVARDDAFTDFVAKGDATTTAAQDWTVKVEASGLPDGETLYYRFKAGEQLSPTGRTRTLPAGKTDKLRIAVVSCANWQHGFFNAYDHIVQQDDFDLVIHLGDYLYEYGVDKGGTRAEATGRYHEPAHEMVELADYRQRHGQYKTDPSLQALHQAYPFICLWDDHEITNDAWRDGAENHQPDEGDYETRKRNAMQAYYEWMPVRDPVAGRSREALFKAYTFGDLATLATIETRLTARAKQVPIGQDSVFASAEEAERFKKDILGAPDRDMISDEQLDHVSSAFKASKDRGEPWRLLGNQILLADVLTPDLTPYISEETINSLKPVFPGVEPFVKNSRYGLPVYEDSWGGYPVAREKLYGRLRDAGVQDILTLTGDAHEFWACELATRSDEKMGVEIGTSSITSETVQDFLGDGTEDYALLMTRENAPVRYYDPMHHGYIELTLTPEKAHTKFIGVSTVLETDYESYVVAAFDIKADNGSLSFSNPQHLGLKQRFVY